MKIVIDIDEYYYRIIKGTVDKGINAEPWTNIANGTPLPKGHGRLIDADALIQYIDEMPSELTTDGRRMIRRVRLTKYIQDTLPTIIKADKEAAE